MHAVLEADNGITFMASDTPNRMEYQAGTNYSMSLSGDNEAELQGYFEKLLAGGNVTMPLEKAPWGDTFGMLTDKFGVSWLVNIAGQKASPLSPPRTTKKARCKVSFFRGDSSFLDLDRSSVLLSGPRYDHEVAAWHVVLSPHDLSDRADGVDNGGARLVRPECLQRLQGAVSTRIVGEREHIGLHGLQPGHCRLQHLHQPLIE